jgi:hypothetical protein
MNMRKVILAMNMSLDGFISGPNGELDWVTMDAEIDMTKCRFTWYPYYSVKAADCSTI